MENLNLVKPFYYFMRAYNMIHIKICISYVFQFLYCYCLNMSQK